MAQGKVLSIEELAALLSLEWEGEKQLLIRQIQAEKEKNKILCKQIHDKNEIIVLLKQRMKIRVEA